MKVLELKTYEILKDKLGEEKAAILLGFAQEKFDEQKNAFRDKFDEQKSDLREVFLTKDDKVDLINRMKDDKIDLIKWMVGFWIAQIAAILGLYFRGH